MANNMLKFRRGTYAQINAAPLDNGTIYIATNEKAMYVDTATERIRIGDFIRVDTVNDITPPYSESALYYVEADNALLKYTGVTGGWKQVNGTDDLADRLEAVEGDVATNKSDIGTLKTDVGTLKTDVSGLKTTVGTHGTDIEALKAAVGMDDEGNVEGLAGSVAQLRTDLTTLETEVHGDNGEGGMKATLANHTGRIAALEEKDVALKSDVAAAKTAILGQTDGADFNGTVKGAYEAAAAAQTQANKGVADAATAQTKANANENAISALDGRLTALDQAGTGKVAVLESKVNTLEKAGYATVTQVNTAKNEVLGAETDAAGAVTVHGALKSAAAAKSAADSAANAASAAQAKADSAYTLADAAVTDGELTEAIKNFATKTEAQGYANNVLGTSDDAAGAATVHGALKSAAAAQSAADAASSAASAAQGAADAAQADATQALADAAAANDNANTRVLTSDFNTFKTSNTAAIADAKKAGTDAQATANANASAISKLQADLKAVTDDYVTESELATVKSDLQAEIDADIRAANAMEYAGTIESASELPATAKNGATYVVGAAFGDYAAGDMLIAQGTENPDTGLITNPTWAHVKSGYDASLDQKLTGADNKIKLSNGVGKAGTEVAFAGSGSIEISTVAATGNKPDTITIGMVWEDFDE